MNGSAYRNRLLFSMCDVENVHKSRYSIGLVCTTLLARLFPVLLSTSEDARGDTKARVDTDLVRGPGQEKFDQEASDCYQKGTENLLVALL